jgi:hypothetical protein
MLLELPNKFRSALLKLAVLEQWRLLFAFTLVLVFEVQFSLCLIAQSRLASSRNLELKLLNLGFKECDIVQLS